MEGRGGERRGREGRRGEGRGDEGKERATDRIVNYKANLIICNLPADVNVCV